RKIMENDHIKLVPREVREASWPEVYFLTDEQQGIYEQEIKNFSGKAYESLNIPKKGSNLFKVLYLNEIGIKTAGLSNLELALENGMDLKGTYEDTPSVVLRSAGDSYEPNDYLAKLLAKELKKRNKKTSFKHPLILNGLKLEEDINSFYGLVLVPNEDFSYFEAHELDHGNNLKKFSKLDERGMPVFDEKGQRTLYTRNDGLSGLCLYDVLDLDAYDAHLANSYAHGRVVVVSPEGAKIFLGSFINS
ncbi:MAG: hypothetical protein AABX77_01620, partial [Nanoarchaeota archaeon]